VLAEVDEVEAATLRLEEALTLLVAKVETLGEQHTCDENRAQRQQQQHGRCSAKRATVTATARLGAPEVFEPEGENYQILRGRGAT